MDTAGLIEIQLTFLSQIMQVNNYDFYLIMNIDHQKYTAYLYMYLISHWIYYSQSKQAQLAVKSRGYSSCSSPVPSACRAWTCRPWRPPPGRSSSSALNLPPTKTAARSYAGRPSQRIVRPRAGPCRAPPPWRRPPAARRCSSASPPPEPRG